MAQKYFIDVVINKEKLSNGKPVYVAHCTTLGIASQGRNPKEAMSNIREAVNLYLEEQPGKFKDLEIEEPPMFSVIEVVKNAKAANIVR